MAEPIKIAEETIRGLVRGGINPREILVGFYNAMAFGYLITKDMDLPGDVFGKKDKLLEVVMNHIEAAQNTMALIIKDYV